MLAERASGDVAQADAGDDRRFRYAEDFLDDAVPDNVDLGVTEQPILQDFLRPQRIAAMNEGHPPGVVSQIDRLLGRGIAAPNHDDVLAAEEKSVAGGTGRHPEAAEDFLARQTEPTSLCAGRYDHRIARIDIPRIGDHSDRRTGSLA